MRLQFIWIGKTKQASLADLEEHYLKRIRRFAPAERVTVPEQQRRDERQRAAAESREAGLIEKRLPPNAHLIVLDERGRQLSSRGLAKALGDLRLQGVDTASFLVGGHSGVPGRMRQKAHRVLSLSDMTLTHEMARSILLEQVYRAFTILEGMPYHK